MRLQCSLQRDCFLKGLAQRQPLPPSPSPLPPPAPPLPPLQDDNVWDLNEPSYQTHRRFLELLLRDPHVRTGEERGGEGRRGEGRGGEGRGR